MSASPARSTRVDPGGASSPPSSPSSPKASRTGEQARLHVSFQDDRRYLERMVARETTERSGRVEAILELKGSLDKSSSAIQTQNAQRQRRERARVEGEQRVFEELLGQGKNPYEVARAKRVAETAAQERKAIEQRIQGKQVEILRHLEVEKVWLARQQRVAEEQRAYERRYQRELGRGAVEARTREYLVRRTGRETLDPTGKAFRLYPSQETTLPDWSFGLGRNLVHDGQQRQAIVDHIHGKPAHAGVAPNPLLLPRDNVADAAASTVGNNNREEDDNGRSPGKRRSIRPTSSSTGAIHTPAASIPGEELREINHVGLATELPPLQLQPRPPPHATTSSSKSGQRPGVVGPTSGNDSTSGGKTLKQKKGFGPVQRSVLEERMLAEARERQKTNIFQKQVVWGKEFTGRAFLAEPAELWFRDFDVGVPMTLVFTLTNVSNTFNYFKLLDLDETLREFFEITYERPGRMSAGMSCRITITFTAIHARDLTTELPAVAQTGAFAIPLRCTCKKAVPVMPERSLSFKEVVAGEKQVLTLVLENQGALPLEFRVRRVRRSRSVREDTTITPDAEVPEEEEEEEEAGENPDSEENNIGEGSTGAEGGGEKVPEQVVGIVDDAQSSPPPDVLGHGPPSMDAADDDRPPEPTLDDDIATEGADADNNISALTSTKPRRSPLLTARLGLSEEETRLLAHARALTVYRPEGAETPLRHTTHGTVAPYSSTTIAFKFAPAAPMELEDEAFTVSFPALQTTHRQATWAPELLRAIPVHVHARAVEVPIYVASEVMDLRCCLRGRLYRSQLVVCNRGKVALKMQVRVPKALEACLEFHPNMGYVQGATNGEPGRFPVQVKFRPPTSTDDDAFLKRLERKGLANASLGFLAVPIQVVVPDQVVSVFFILTSRLTPGSIEFSPRRLDFGPCPLNHSTALELTVTNASHLPQRFAFVKLPPEIRLEKPSQPSANVADDGLGTLLPLETRVLRVIYQPNAATTMNARLVCKTTNNDEYVLPATGEGVAVPLTLSHTVVELATTQLGQRQTFSIFCRNNSDKSQTLELVVPMEAQPYLRVTPTVATVPPRRGIRVEIEFTAGEELFTLGNACFPVPVQDPEVAPSTHGVTSILVETSRQQPVETPSSMVGLGITTAPWAKAGGVAAERRSLHISWTVLCFRQGDSTATPVALQVRTTVIEPQVFATPPALDFGQVAIGQVLRRELRLTNERDLEIELSARPLHALGGFRMINSLKRRIPRAGGSHVLQVEFRPQSPLLYEDELELSCPEIGVINVPLLGQGINPSLRIEPADGVVDFKDVLARNRLTSEVTLTNASAFPLNFEIVPVEEDGSGTRRSEAVTTLGLPVFTFTPSVATIPADGSLVVKVLFAPDHQRPEHYQQRYLIQVPNESERHILSLTGRCWENQVYVFNPTEPARLHGTPAVEDFFDVPPTVNLSSLLATGPNAGLLSALAAPGIKKPMTTLTVIFDEDTAPIDPRVVYVGGTTPPHGPEEDGTVAPTKTGAAAANAVVGSFEFVIEENPDKPAYAKLFTVEPMKGTVASGQQVPVQINYLGSSSSSSQETTTAREHPELVVSQWIQVKVTCTLRGGFLWRHIPPTAAPGTSGTTTTGQAASGGKGAAGGPAAANAGADESRTVQLILRAKMRT